METIHKSLATKLHTDPYLQLLGKEIGDVQQRVSNCVRLSCGGSLMVHAMCGMSTALGVVDMGIEQFMEDNRENLKRKLVVVRLNGLVLTTDRICLQEIARQLNIAFDGDDDEQKMSTAASMQYFIDQLRQAYVFVLEHFERIVVQLSQSLLYSLVGPTHEHNSLPILVISVTGAWDAMENMEKRVRSRLAQQPLFIDIGMYLKTCDDYVQLIKRVLTIDGKGDVVKRWNAAIQKTFSDRDVYECCDMSFSRSTGSDELQRFMKTCLAQIISTETTLDVQHVIAAGQPTNQMNLLIPSNTLWATVLSFSSLEVCILLAVRDVWALKESRQHGVNFERVRRYYHQHINRHHIGIVFDTDTVYKAFEKLLSCNILCATSFDRHQTKTFRTYTLEVTGLELADALEWSKQYLPVWVQYWIDLEPVA